MMNQQDGNEASAETARERERAERAESERDALVEELEAAQGARSGIIERLYADLAHEQKRATKAEYERNIEKQNADLSEHQARWQIAERRLELVLTEAMAVAIQSLEVTEPYLKPILRHAIAEAISERLRALGCADGVRPAE